MIERTTIVAFESGDERAELFTSSPIWQERIDRLCHENPDCQITEVIRDPQGRVIGKHYNFPKALLKIEGV